MVYVKIVNSILSLCTLLRLQTKASNLLSFLLASNINARVSLVFQYLLFVGGCYP